MGDEWNPDALSFSDGAKKLKTCVMNCCTKEFHMDATAVSLVKESIPEDFNNFNGPPKGCVEIEVEITKQKQEKEEKWVIIVDADQHTAGVRPQRAHYGYTVALSGPGKGKFTGHVWLPQDPPNYRPWKEDKGKKVRMGGREVTKGGITYKSSGVMYNQYK